ncbi:MAG TPA: DNA repair protein RecN [Candidatus Tectomicrobia bacterium]|nr:DNA repair protein RecN [Candidatus Tectomicrobia bacterium]
MLKELRITNFAIIDALHVHFSEGLHVFTGETGAGKSIIIEALSLALGGRASAEMIRSGEDTATIEAAFDLAGHAPVVELARTHGIDVSSEELVIKRAISASRSRVYANGTLSTVSVLELLGAKLVQIHGQYEQQTLLHPDHQLDIFDSYAGVLELRRALERHYYYLQGLRKRLADLNAAADERARRQQLLRFQLQDIDQAKLRPGEEEELKGERHVLMHTEKLLQITQGSSELLYAGDDTLVERLGRVLPALEEVSAIDPVLRPIAEELRTALYQLEEAGRTLGDYASRVEFDPVRLAEIEERLAELSTLKRKYGATVDDILSHRESLAKELDTLNHQAENIDALHSEIDTTERQVREQALELSRQRMAAGVTLAEAVERELHALSMSAARFVISFRRTPDPAGFIVLDGAPVQLTPAGIESVEFLFTSNPGEEPRPLAKIASGGEVSRVMLALKSILAAVEQVPTLVFDEVDTGIGGGVAEVVGRKLKALTKSAQVFCVTHLPQVASRGDVHFLIEKQVVLGRTVTTVRPLTQRERVDEIARMSGGLVITETTRKLAAELLRQGAKD